jgi:AbrB family looped-hinge helix DNA binding protein
MPAEKKAAGAPVPTNAAKIRAMAAEGMARADIARALKIRYQQVRNVLERDRAKTQAASGLSEPGRPYVAAEDQPSAKVRLGPDGRIVVPAPMREALGLKEGDVLFARLEGGEIKLLTPAAAMLRAQAIVRRFVPDSVSLVDELIADRRREAERESKE